MRPTEKKRNAKKIRRQQRVERRSHALQRKREKDDNKIRIRIGPYDKSLVPEEFVTEVIDCLKNIRLNDRSLFNTSEERVFKSMKETGIKEIKERFWENDTTEEKFSVSYLLFKMAETVYGLLNKKNILLKYIPYAHAFIIPAKKEFVVVFRALLKHRSSFGTAYYSPSRPIIRINGKEYVVAFSRHAIERVCERLVSDYPTFSGANTVFLYLERCIRYDLVEAPDGTEDKYLITFYGPCSTLSGNMFYATEVLGAVEDHANYGYRLGYCPIEINGDFACATTLLTPGMKGTPEDLLIKTSNLSYDERIKIRANVQELIALRNWDKNQNMEAIIWFHLNGVPQVIKMDDEFYRDILHPYFERMGIEKGEC
jgi:hypothetical protein